MSEPPVIKPVRYQPQNAIGGRRIKISPAQTGLLAAALIAVALLSFLFTARSVEISFTPAADMETLSGGPVLQFGGVYLLLRGNYQLQANLEGYHPLIRQLEVSLERNQAFSFQFEPLPGLISATSIPAGAQLWVDGRAVGATPLVDTPVEAGQRRFRLTHPRHQMKEVTVAVVGRQQPQQVQAELLPNWGEVKYVTEPLGASILVDGEDSGVMTPGTVEILAGEHEVALALAGHQTHRQRILIAAQEERAPPLIRLKKSDALLAIHTKPQRAGVTINGQYQGDSPLTAQLQSGRTYQVQTYKAGFEPRKASLSLKAGETRTLSLDLVQLMGLVSVEAVPTEAQLYVDGHPLGPANQTIELPVHPHRVEIQAPGYAGYQTEMTPRQGLTKQLRVKLLTLEQARLAALRPEITTADGQTLKLFQPSPLTLGASRREPGRRANETLRQVELTRLFYLGVQEVTNAEFKRFAAGHDSGAYEDQPLNKDGQPVAEVSWLEVALYCNWLSRRDNLPPFYREEFGKVSGYDANATGYRLPTEAEWAWAARHQSDSSNPLRFPWGDTLPPPDRHGNYADRSAGHLVGRIIFGYNDNHAVAAPVGTFKANAKGLFDLGGNVAEWTHDYYQHPAEEGVGPLGPPTGEYHVIRGSSWMHGTTTDLRLSFRDYGIKGRPDLGFRMARFAEPQT